MKKTYALVLSVVLPLVSAQAQEKVDLQASAYRNSIAQDEVRKQADEVRQSLTLLLQDFYQNQLQTKGSAEARNVAEQLASLTDQQIAPLVQMLKEAGTLQGGQGVEGKLATASQGQKKVQVDLKSLESRLALHINLASTQQRLQQLVLRQTGNLRHTKDLAASGKPIKQLPGNLQPIVGLWQSEQSALKQEIDLTLEAMTKVVAEVPEAERPGFAQALDEAKRTGVGGQAATASEQTALGKFPTAMTAQSGVLDGLQAMLMKLKAGQPTEERVQAMKDKLQQLAEAQQQLAEASKKADDTTKREIREAQAQLSDQVAALKKEATGLNAEAAMKADQATPSMEKASDILRDTPRLTTAEKNDVVKAQEAAAKDLQAASNAMQQQLDKLAAQNTAPQTPAQAMQALAKLDQQVKTAAAQQQAMEGNPNAAAQQQLAKQTADLQQQALPMSPQAAQSLGEAAAQMQQDPAQAAQALSQASQAIQQQMQALNQATAQQQQMQALANQIAAAQTQTQQAAQTLGEQGKPDLNPAIQKMQQAKQALQQAATAPGSPEGVQEALKDAEKGLDSSILNAAQMKKDPAAAANGEAQKSMEKAMGAVGEALAEAAAQAAAAAPGMAGQPGKPGAPQPGQPGQPGAPMPGEGMEGMSVDGQSGQGMMGGVQQRIASSGQAGGKGQVNAGLKPKDRESIAMFKKEKAPAEYQGMVQQYLKNLAEGSAPTGSLE